MFIKTKYFIILFIFVYLFVATVQIPNFMEYEKEVRSRHNQALFTKNVLKLYVGFDLTFHVENQTVRKIEYLLKLLHEPMFGEIVIINQDANMLSQFLGRNGFPLLHIILLENLSKFESFLNNCNSCITAKDVIFVLFTAKQNDHQLLSMPKLDWAGNVIIINVRNLPISIYSVCYFCGENSKRLNLLQRSNSSEIKFDIKQLLPRNYSNFHLHHFKVGYINSFPFMLCSESKSQIIENQSLTSCNKATGFEIRVLEELSKKNNFTFSLYEHTPSLNKTDTDINKCNKVYFDFIIGGVSATAARAPKISFTSPLAFEPYTFVYIPKELILSKLLDNAKPFSFYVWIIIICSLITFSISLYICVKLSDDYRLKTDFSLSKCFKVCCKSILEQTEFIHFKPHPTFSYLIVLWWLISLILVTFYKSKFWAISIRQHHLEPSNLQELLDSDYEIVVDSENNDIMEDIFNNNETIVMQAKRRLVVKNNTCNCIAYITNERAALLEEYSTIQYHSLAVCSNILKTDVYSKLRITRVALRHTTHSWPLRMGAPYKQAFNLFLTRLDAAGLISKWRSETISSLEVGHQYNNIPFSQSNVITEPQEIGFLHNFLSVFAFYVLGNTLSVILFFAELVYYWLSN